MSDDDFRKQYENQPTFPTVATYGIGKIVTYTGFRFTEDKTFKGAKQSYMLDWAWTTVPWYARLLGLLRLPYDLVKFVATGRLILIPWPWRW